MEQQPAQDYCTAIIVDETNRLTQAANNQNRTSPVCAEKQAQPKQYPYTTLGMADYLPKVQLEITGYSSVLHFTIKHEKPWPF